MSVTIRLDALALDDVPACARLHRTAFPDFFLSQLGEPFLREFYRGFATQSGAVGFVARDPVSRTITGVAVGHLAPERFFKELLRLRWFAFASASLGTAARRPSTVPRLIRAIRYRGAVPFSLNGALLSSICVDPQMRGAGIGGRLVSAWLAEVNRRGQDEAYLTTDAYGNDPTNSFYVSQGWQPAGDFPTPEGRTMRCYVWSGDQVFEGGAT